MNGLSERDVAKLYSIADVLGTAKRNVVCPLPHHKHANYTPSLNVYHKNGKENWFCHGSCGVGGDVIDLVGHMEVPGYDDKNADHLRQAIAILTNKYTINPPKKQKERRALHAGILTEMDDLSLVSLEYLAKRGISAETARQYMLREKGAAIAIPIFENHELKAIKYRSIHNHAPLRYWSESGSSAALFNYDGVKFKSEPVLIVKGELAALVLLDRGILACAPNSGEQGTQPEWLGIMWFSKRIVVGDNDPDKLEKSHGWARARAKILQAHVRFPPLEYKDIDEWVLNDAAAIETIKEWMNGSDPHSNGR